MSCRITGKICDAWSDVAGCGLFRCKFAEKKDGGKILNGETVKDCHQMTNADRIRAMSDDELCKFLGEYKFCDICEEGCDSCTYNGDCDKRLFDWLKQPAEEMLTDEQADGGDD